MESEPGLWIFDATHFLDASRSHPGSGPGRLSLENAPAKAASRIRSPPALYSACRHLSGVTTWSFVRAISRAGWPAGASRTTAIFARLLRCRATRLGKIG